jgi:hypothetical protein
LWSGVTDAAIRGHIFCSFPRFNVRVGFHITLLGGLLDVDCTLQPAQLAESSK